MAFAGRPLVGDVSPAAWVTEAVQPAGATIASLVPPVFAAYARVFHPAARYVGLDDVDVSWAEVAAANRTVAHPAMEWGSITGAMEFFEEADQSPLWDGAPARGHLPEAVATRLAAVLTRHTSTPQDCWFGVWHGFPDLAGRGGGRPRLVLIGREYWLLRGPVSLASANLAPEPAEQSASLWWPAGREWFVGTGVDLVTTCVGGSRSCIDDLLAAPGLEVAEVAPGQRVTWDADTVNPPPYDAP